MQEGRNIEHLLSGTIQRHIVERIASDDDDVDRILRGIYRITNRQRHDKRIVGKTPKDPELQRYYQEFEQKFLQIIKKAQPYDPENPAPPFAKHIRDRVEAKLSCIKDLKRVRYYTTIDSPLDQFGYDGFVEAEFYDSKRAIVTIDITLDPHKVLKRADCIFVVPRGFNQKHSDFEEKIEDYSTEIFNNFMAKYNSNKLLDENMKPLNKLDQSITRKSRNHERRIFF